MIKIHCYLLTGILLLSYSCAIGQNDDCVFNPDSINEDFLKSNSNIKSYNWSDLSKEATILMKTGEYVFVKKWACTSYGMEAKMIIVEPLIISDESAYWVTELMEFGKQFLSKGDFSVYQSAISKSDWLKGVKIGLNSKHEIDIPHNNYPEFYASIERNNDMLIMSFYFYMN